MSQRASALLGPGAWRAGGLPISSSAVRGLCLGAFWEPYEVLASDADCNLRVPLRLKSDEISLNGKIIRVISATGMPGQVCVTVKTFDQMLAAGLTGLVSGPTFDVLAAAA